MFTIYFYNPERDTGPEDCNILYANKKFLSHITSCHIVKNLSEIEKEDEKHIVFIDCGTPNLHIKNYNPCPEEF